MAIDEPFDAIRAVYPPSETHTAEAVTDAASVGLAVGSVVLPWLAVPAAVLASWTRFTDNREWKARTEATLALLVERLRSFEPAFKRLEEQHKTLAVASADLEASVRTGVFQDGINYDDHKRERFIAVVANAAISDTQIADLTGFIKNLDELNEQDIAALRAVNRVMNKPSDWDAVQPNQRGIHPNILGQRGEELSLEIATALGKNVNITIMGVAHAFSREEGLGLCLRLQGFGLAEVMSSNTREVPRADFIARLTTRGMMLLKLLGDDVPNWNRYFDEAGPL